MLKAFRNSFNDFKRSYLIYLSFEVIYTFLASLLFIPFLTYLFNRVVMMVGKGHALINNEVYQIGWNFKSMTGLFGIAFLAVTVLFVEFGVIIIIAQKNYFHQHVGISQAFRTAVGKLPKLIGFGILQLFFLFVIVIPFLDSSTLPSFLDINVTIMLTELFERSIGAKLVYTFLFIALFYIYTRWIYTLHFIFIENKSITQAMAASWRLTRHGKMRLLATVVLWNLGILAFGFIMITILSYTVNIIDSKVISDFARHNLLSFSSYVTIVVSLFLVPMNMIMLTRFYYHSLAEKGMPAADRLDLQESAKLSRLETAVTRQFKRKRGIVLSIAAASLTAVILINGIVESSIVYLPWNVEVAGHRGDGYSAPENTASSVQSGIQKGVDAVEIDVTLTKDNVLVLSHDLDLQRLANVPVTIREENYSDIANIDIGSSFDESYAGETLATLGDILDITTASNTKVIIDVKTDTDEDIYAQEIAHQVEKHDAEELALVQSFNPTFLKLMREENQEMDIGQILFLYAGSLSGLDVDFYTVRETMLTKRFVQQAQKQNRDIWVWTVNNQRNINKVLDYDIDGIITDYPERVQQTIGINPVNK